MEIVEGSVEANGLRFATLSCGAPEAPLALCLHGFPDSAWTFRHLLLALADRGLRAVAPWTRGYAPTSLAADYSVQSLAVDANALHESLGGGSDAVLIGHDWGAITAYAAAHAAPARWRRVVTMAVPPPGVAAAAFFRFEQMKRSFYVYLFQTPLAELAVGADDLAFIDGLWRDWEPGYDATVDLARVKAALRSPENLSAAIGYYRAMFSGGALPQESCPQPTLYLHGEADGAFLLDGARDAAAELSPGSQMTVVERAGHFLHLSRPEVVNQHILDWVS